MSNVTKEMALDYHKGDRPGKIETIPTKPYSSQRDLSLAYSPGVAYPCLEIEKNPQDAYEYILYLKEAAKANGKTEITIKALDIARHFKRYDRIVPMCGAMRKAMNPGDVIIHTPPKGNSTTLEIKYMLK